MGMPETSEPVAEACEHAGTIRMACATLADAKVAHGVAFAKLDTSGMMTASLAMQEAGGAINQAVADLVGLVQRLDGRLNGDIRAVLRTAPQDHTSWDAFASSGDAAQRPAASEYVPPAGGAYSPDMVEVGPRYV